LNRDDTISAIGAITLELLAAREPTASVCPSEVARALAVDPAEWRALMPEVRRVAALLAEQGLIRVTRGDATVHALSEGGPIRLRRPAAN